MLDRWESDTVPADPLAQLVYQSRLVGAEESLVLWGGGNNSIKLGSSDLLGHPVEVMYVKGSGSDMKSIVERQYPAVRLDWVLPLRSRSAMTDEDMVDYLARCLIDPKSPRPSIETLLHGFLPFRSILHTHADAILAVTNNRGREQTVRDCFGQDVVILPYLRPGFALSRLVGAELEKDPRALAMILMNHGLITWGETPEEAYRRHIALVTRAEEFVTRRTGSVQAAGLSFKSTDAASIAPILRGLLSSTRSVVLEYDGGQEVLAFLSRPDAREATQIGPATPDHLLYTRRYPLFLEIAQDVDPGDLRRILSAALEQFVEKYRTYFEAHAGAGDTMLDPLPRVVLIPGAGMWTAGKDARAAKIVRDIYRHTMEILSSAQTLGGFETLSDRDAFEAEYWPLELYKLTLLPKDKDLAGKVVLVTGAGSGIGRAIAVRFAEEGAHVAVTDLNMSAAEDVAGHILQNQGLKRATALLLDVTSPEGVQRAVETAVMIYGGLDIVVSNAGIAQAGSIDHLSLEDWQRSLAVNATGHFLVARAALSLMKRQGTGGNVLFIASKNVTAPGKDFGAYSVAKAAEAQLCRIVAIEGGEFGIRANMLNPDAVFIGSKLWSEEIRRQRAAAYGFDVEKISEYYQQRNLLKASITAEDVAEAALFLAGPRSAKITGAMLPVDGGVREAFVR